MIQFKLNGEVTCAPRDHSLAQLVEQLGLTGRRLAIELNDEVVPRSQHASLILKDNDRVEIVHAIGGG